MHRKTSPTTRSPNSHARRAKRASRQRFTSYVLKAVKYAEDVRAKRIPACKYVRQACTRQLKDLKRWATRGTYRFDETEAAEWCEFVEQLPHIKGAKAGENIQLEPWQCFVITAAFGWVRRDTGKRRFRRVYIEVPRGNAKSTLTSTLALKAGFADGEGGAEVYSAATTRDQARIVFADAQAMARKRPELCEALGIEVNAHAIVQKSTSSVMMALSADANTLDGKNIHFAAVDELHAHRTREVFDVLETGTGKRAQSMLWCITTAGSDRAGVCYEQRTYALKVLGGIAPDDSLFAVIYSIDDEDDWTLESSWIKANPNWGVSVQPEIVAQLAAKAMQMPAAQSNFKTKHLNVWVNADQAWMDMRAWDRAADTTLVESEYDKDKTWLGLDLASKTDIAARIRISAREIDGVTHYYLFGRYFLPEQAVEDGRNSQYRGWETSGLLTVTPGDTLDFQVVIDDIQGIASKAQVEEIGYDPWQATFLAQKLTDNGATMVEVRNTVGNFSAPMKEFDALVRQGRLHHNGDPVLTWMVSNVVCHTDAKENIYPRKERPENKIDGVVAAITALARALAAVESGEPFTEL
jgi:phage terminase large subunit-like protein